MFYKRKLTLVWHTLCYRLEPSTVARKLLAQGQPGTKKASL